MGQGYSQEAIERYKKQAEYDKGVYDKYHNKVANLAKKHGAKFSHRGITDSQYTYSHGGFEAMGGLDMLHKEASRHHKSSPTAKSAAIKKKKE
jgi:hypothetical protein